MQFLNKYRFLDTKLRLELLCTFESTAANANGLGKTYETQAKKCQRADPKQKKKKTTTLRDILNIELSALSQFNHNTSIKFHFLPLILLSLDGDQSCRC